MSAWGKTGRVWVDRSSDGEYNDVYAVGVESKIGNVDRRYGELGWRVVTWDVNDNRHEARIDSFDEAVMWVLRRARPDVWREERGTWLVRKRRGGDFVENGWRSGARYPAMSDWLIIDPEGSCRNAATSLNYGCDLARQYAREGAR